MMTFDLAHAHIRELRREADNSRRGRLPVERRAFRLDRAR